MLTDLGWRIHRVWSTDWWNDPQGALDRLDTALRADLDADRAKPEPVATEPDTPDIPQVEPPAIYEPADLSGFSPNAARFHEVGYEATLAAMASEVVLREGPVFADILAERLLRAHGFARITARLRQRALGAVDPHCPHTSEGERIVLWPGVAPAGPVRFRPAQGDGRAPADIPLQELAGLARDLDPAPGVEGRMAAQLGPRPDERGGPRPVRRGRLAGAGERSAGPETRRMRRADRPPRGPRFDRHGTGVYGGTRREKAPPGKAGPMAVALKLRDVD